MTPTDAENHGRGSQLNTLGSIISQVYTRNNQLNSSFEEKLEFVLESSVEELGYPIGYATRIENQLFEVIATAGEANNIVEYFPDHPRDTLSQIVVNKGKPHAIESISQSDSLGDHPMCTKGQLESYVSAPIVAGDDTIGTVCFAGYKPAKSAAIESDKPTVEILAQWIGSEYERHQQQEELQQQAELFEEFTSGVTHDLKTPLSVAKGRVKQAQDEDDTSYLVPASEALDRMQSIINDTLRVAKQSGKIDEKKEIKISEVINNIKYLFQDSDVDIRIIDDFTVHGDKEGLKHVFENLFSNAQQHGEGPVVIRVGLSNNVFTSTRAPPTQKFEFYVEDNGPGIEKSRRKSVFEAGESSRVDGTGFGLSIVKQIVQAHDWEITVTESFDGGARFEFKNVW
jgi:Signal transduction histidine kinase